MIYVKRIVNADITRQIDLNKEAAEDFFKFDGDTRNLIFENEDTSEKISGTIKKTGHTVTIIGEIFSLVKKKCTIDDIVIFHSSSDANKYSFHVSKQGTDDYKAFERALSIFGSRSRKISKTTHLIAEIDEGKEVLKNNDLYSSKIIILALKTKSFLLLAGISGTGKSQKVQELAYMSCPKELQDEKGTTPGNYCLIEVKPNWHDSTELLGYYSALSEKYMLTDFIRFVYKAIMHPDYPFFLCLDEMNLAPVEQYFAEYLSVLETRKLVDGKIESQPLLSADKFANCKVHVEEQKAEEKNSVSGYDSSSENEESYSDNDSNIIKYLKKNGLELPSNLFVIGTVNMDDTTHQFSRKVIDRAFTIEMNGGKMEDMFSTESKQLLSYREEPVPLEAFQSRFVKAHEVLDDEQFSQYSNDIKTKIPSILGDPESEYNTNSINGILSGTPFRVSYRVQNELVLYLSTLIENANYPENIDGLIREAVLAILLQKILPRVQGEESQLKTNEGKSNILADLKTFVQDQLKPISVPMSTDDDHESLEGETTEPTEIATSSSELFNQVVKKLKEMEDKLAGYYTNFF